MAGGHCGVLLDFLCNKLTIFIFMAKNWSWDDLRPKKRKLRRTPQDTIISKESPQKVTKSWMISWNKIQQNLQGVLYRFVLCKCVDALVPHLLSGRIWVDDSSNRWLVLESRYLLYYFLLFEIYIYIYVYIYMHLRCYFDSYPQNGAFRIYDLYTWICQFGCLTCTRFQKKVVNSQFV